MLASGRPLVASSTHGSELAELASEAVGCTTPREANAFADAVSQLISDPEHRLIVGNRARRLAEERLGRMTSLNVSENSCLQWCIRITIFTD